MDELSAVLEAVRLRGELYCRLEARAPWAMRGPPSPVATFHGVLRGRAVLQIPGESDTPLEAGDVAVLCHGSGHAIGDVPGRTPALIHDVLASGNGAWLVRTGGGGAQTQIVCGGFSTRREGPPLLELMPAVLHLRGNPRVARLLELLGAEGSAPGPGAHALVSRLTEALFVEVARAWVASEQAGPGHWISALKDPRIARTLAAIHKDPARHWSVESLARLAGMSRSAFALQFGQWVGSTPLAYVARWRLYTARVLLRESPRGIADIAAHVGYESEAALSKAFRRQFGMPPGAYRKSARERAHSPAGRVATG